MAANVPKFASFRPKPKIPSEVSKEPPKPETTSSKSTKKEFFSDKTKSSAAEKPKPEKEEASSKLYFSDRRGDSEVLRYGSLNRYDIPMYRRFGYGHVLGLDSTQKIDRAQSSESKVYITPATRQRQERLLTRKTVAKEGSRTLRFIKGGDTQTDIDSDFILISSARRKDVEHDTDEDDLLSHPDFRDLEMKRESSQPVDEETRYNSEEPERTDTGRGIRMKNSELVRRTREVPEDIQGWLSFIEHQEAMMLLDSIATELTDPARRQLADVRIPIYEEALKKVQNDPCNHITLYEGLFREAKRSWNEAKLSTMWKAVLKKFPGSTNLWFMYLDFVQSNFARFKYELCRTVFLECLAAIQADTDGATIDTMLHVFLRMTVMIQGAGYQELALAIWQALLENHVLRSTSTNLNSKDDLPQFGEFWESEAPRIGEIGANGWRKVGADEQMSDTAALWPKHASDSTFEDFRKRETDNIDKLRYPGRTSDEIGEDDAFHTIFYNDIEEYLAMIPADTPSSLVVEAFLCFCGLPPPPRSVVYQKPWWNDSFLLHAGANSISPGHAQGDLSAFLQKMKTYANCGLSSMQMTSDLLFKQTFPLESARISADFMRRLLKLVAMDSSSDDKLGEYLLAFELQYFPSDAFKTAKQLLKIQPTSQRLYNAYGLMESHRGNNEKANQVFSMAISMSAKLPSAYDSSTLLNSWVWEALHTADQVEALWRLVSPLGHLPQRKDPKALPDKASVLLTRTVLSDNCEKALLRQDFQSATVGTSLLALIAYLSNGCKFEDAIAAHDNLTNWFASNKLSTSPHAELNAQSMARLLTYHIDHASIVKPALTRSALEPLITLFPDNTILLSLYAANEARFAIDDRVRGIMHQSALQGSESTTIAGWAFAIHFETVRGEVGGSTSHSIRALYKRATNTESSGAHCPALWSSYFRFELALLNLERSKAAGKKSGKDKKRTWESRLEEVELRIKETFYQGLRSLPWCKDFMMLAFTEAGSVFTEEELWKVYRIMQEKELRLYVELD